MFTKLKDYFVGIYRELHKVTWLTKKQILSHTLIVLGVSIGVAVFMTLFDFGFGKLYQYFLNNF